MSESWPYFLIIAYVVFLLGTLFKFPTLLAEELKLLGWYLAVGLLVAVWTHDRFVFRDGPVPEGVEINLLGLLRNYWFDVIRPFTIGFIALSLPRLLMLLFLNWRKRKQRKQQTA